MAFKGRYHKFLVRIFYYYYFIMVDQYFQGLQNHHVCTRSLSGFANILLHFNEKLQG